jgi:hypothetical protein
MLLKIVLFSLLFVAISAATSSEEEEELKDYDDYNWSKEEDEMPEIDWISNPFPYIASVRYEEEHYCVGTILSNRWVMTVANCFDNDRDKSELRVYVGSASLTDSTQFYKVKEVITHPLFVARKLDYDIALLKTKTIPMIAGIVAPLQLIGGRRNINFNFETKLAGWMRQNHRIAHDSEIAGYRTISDQVCRSAWWSNTSPRMFCATGNFKGLTGCLPDVGSPLVNDGIVFGIYSWGSSNCGVDLPHVFTNITNTEIRGFIRRNAGF